MSARVDPRTGAASEGSLSIIDLKSDAPPVELVTGRHASGLAVSPDERFLCVACAASDFVEVLDLAKGVFTGHFFPKQTPADLFGAAPNALAFSESGKSLFVCNGSQNAVAVVEFADGRTELEGLVPTGWYPGAILFDRWRRQLCVANLKGIGSAPDKLGGFNSHQYFGTLSLIPQPHPDDELDAHTQTVLANNRVPLIAAAFAKPRPTAPPRPVPLRVGEPSVFKHVLYIIKENRTYDQVLGDLPEGNGDPKLCIYGEAVTPNQHKLCREFALLDNTYCSGILSADGHNWSCSAISTDYVEKQFAGFPRSYPDGCTTDDADALAWSPAGFLWDAALAKHHRVRIYGEFCNAERAWSNPARQGQPGFTDVLRDLERPSGQPSELALRSTPNLASIRPHICATFPAFENDIPDVARVDRFFADLAQQETLPNLMVMSLPGDHTSGTQPGKPTPRTHVADNDLAVGRIVAGLSHSPAWKDTCIFIIEDDPQNGWDHVSGYRTTCYVASAWSRQRGVIHTQYNQTSVLRTIELILGLPPMNELDATATPMFDCFDAQPDFTPFEIAATHLPLDVLNPAVSSIQDPAQRHDAEVSATLPLDEMDQCPEDILNGILWRAERGSAPFPTWAVAEVDDD